MSQSERQSLHEQVLQVTNRAQDVSTVVYKPLVIERREIRLLTLSPGESWENIHCRLSTHSLDDCPPYEALSYVWGEGGFHGRVYLDSIPTEVTWNLRVALEHLRHVTEFRVLWIDAICINQEDIPERNTQVTHMGSIYQSASRVIAWLGEESEDSNSVFDTLETLPTDEYAHWDLAKSQTGPDTFLGKIYAIAFSRLMYRAWWHRVWTVQESILAPTLYFVCGNRQISADAIFPINRGYTKHSRSCCRHFLWRPAIGGGLPDFLERIGLLERLRLRKEASDLTQLLTEFRSQHCTDPRDRVYGFLGLCSADERQHLLPDYSMSVSLVYEKAALHIINYKQCLKIFSQVCRFLDGSKIEGVALPSWAPDWTLEMTERQHTALAIRQERNDDYKASSGADVSIKYLSQGKIALKGVLLGLIGDLGSAHPGEPIMKSTCDNWRELAQLDTLPHRLYNKETSVTFHDAYWQTLCASILLARTSIHDAAIVIRTRNDSSYYPWYDAWWTWMSKFDGREDMLDNVSSEYSGSEIQVFDASVEVSTSMRRMFISEDQEWLGLAPMNAIAGDVIALLEGGTVPYILRLKSDTQTEEYELVGDAYVHGAMDGERWNVDQLREIVLV